VGESAVGNRTKVTIVKNKLAPPFRKAEFDIYYGKGVSQFAEVVDMGLELNLVRRSGSWYSIGDDRIGQGRDAAIRYLEEHPDVLQRLKGEIRTRYQPTAAAASEAADD
jgi:recombination protein RecA